MPQDTPTWVQAGAAVVQALAALAVVYLTIQLIGATKAYVETTRQQVAASEAQLAELREQRAATFRPLIHALNVGSSSGGGRHPQIELQLENLGNGPAIDLALNDATLFVSDSVRVSISPGKTHLLTLTAIGDTLAPMFDVPLVYIDLQGGRWVSTVGVDMERPGGFGARIVRNDTRAG